jgi:hypothetical protein
LPWSGLEASEWKPDRIQAGFYVGQRFRYEQTLPAGFTTQWEQSSRSLYQANVVLALDLDWYSFGAVSCVLDSGEISEDTIQDGTLENDRTDDAFFQEGYFESYFLDEQGIAFKVGQQHIVSGESYILDDFLLAGQIGLNLHAMLDLPWELYGSVTRVQGSSLYFQLKKRFTPSQPTRGSPCRLGGSMTQKGCLPTFWKRLFPRFPGLRLRGSPLNR